MNPPIDSPASANRSGATARIDSAIAAIESWRVWSATLIAAMSPSAANCGAHKALVHSRPGTSTRFVASAISPPDLQHSLHLHLARVSRHAERKTGDLH